MIPCTYHYSDLLKKVIQFQFFNESIFYKVHVISVLRLTLAFSFSMDSLSSLLALHLFASMYLLSFVPIFVFPIEWEMLCNF